MVENKRKKIKGNEWEKGKSKKGKNKKKEKQKKKKKATLKPVNLKVEKEEEEVRKGEGEAFTFPDIVKWHFEVDRQFNNFLLPPPFFFLSLGFCPIFTLVYLVV